MIKIIKNLLFSYICLLIMKKNLYFVLFVYKYIIYYTFYYYMDLSDYSSRTISNNNNRICSNYDICI